MNSWPLVYCGSEMPARACRRPDVELRDPNGQRQSKKPFNRAPTAIKKQYKFYARQPDVATFKLGNLSSLMQCSGRRAYNELFFFSLAAPALRRLSWPLLLVLCLCPEYIMLKNCCSICWFAGRSPHFFLLTREKVSGATYTYCNFLWAKTFWRRVSPLDRGSVA